MLSPFRKNHILWFFENWEEYPQSPLDKTLNLYLRKNSSIGSKDRLLISNTIYAIIKWKSLIDAYLTHQGTPISYPHRLDFWINHSLNDIRKAPFLKEHEKFGFPEDLFNQLKQSLGAEKAIELCEVTQTRAPIFVRTNLHKTTRESLFHGWKDRYQVSLCEESNSGILFHEKINFFTLPEFTKGLFEVQDEASQLVSNLVDVKPGDEVLDYCAGAGGKSLSFAPKMKGKGQIFLYDLRHHALLAAKKRLKRCGVQNAQIVTEEKGLNRLKGRMDWVLLDVPCTGSGTWRRKPDQRWRYTTDMLQRLVQEQRQIFEKGLQFLSPQGRIVYSTCSVLPEENEKQIEYFCQKFGCTLEGAPLTSFPQEGKMDGFFGATFSLAKIKENRDNSHHAKETHH